LSNEPDATTKPLNSSLAGMSMRDLVQYLGIQSRPIGEAAAYMIRALNTGHMVAWCGNGGSDAEAQHMAGELLGRMLFDRPPLKSMALAASGPTTSAIANDQGWDVVFARQATGLLGPGDVLIAFSTSGASLNVRAGLHAARAVGAITIAVIGRPEPAIIDGLGNPDVVIPVTVVTSVPDIQVEHQRIGHQLCTAVEAALFGGPTV